MQTLSPTLEIYDRSTQAQGSFDYGRIREYKVVGMPQDRTPRQRIGPLFYWAWATGAPNSRIALHSHRGFEILSYVLSGTLIHHDTLGTRRAVQAGGLQLMQTGSGLAHEELMGEQGAEFLQIWLEPHLPVAIAQPPTYQDIADAEFLLQEHSGGSIKQVLGDASPARLQVPTNLFDIALQPHRPLPYKLLPNRAIAVLMVSGQATWQSPIHPPQLAQLGDLVVIQNPTAASILPNVLAGPASARLIVVDIPLTVDYPLFPHH